MRSFGVYIFLVILTIAVRYSNNTLYFGSIINITFTLQTYQANAASFEIPVDVKYGSLKIESYIDVSSSMFYTFYPIFSDEIYQTFEAKVESKLRSLSKPIADALLVFKAHMDAIRGKVNEMRAELHAYTVQRNVSLNVVANRIGKQLTANPTNVGPVVAAMSDVTAYRSTLAKCYANMLKKIFPIAHQDTVGILDMVIEALSTNNMSYTAWLEHKLPIYNDQLKDVTTAIAIKNWEHNVMRSHTACISVNASVFQRKLEHHLLTLLGKPTLDIVTPADLGYTD